MLVVGALACNALLGFLWTVNGGAQGAVMTAVMVVPIAVVLGLGPRRYAFRLLAGTLGVLHAALVVLTIFFGGMVLVPTTLCLLCAALLPGQPVDRTVRRRRHLKVLSALAAATTATAAVLVLLAL
jgi:hypothetical protein